MGPRNGPQRCGECQVGVGVVIGMSGDLVCADCADKQRINARGLISNEITSVKKPFSGPSTTSLSTVQSSKDEIIFNALLAYVLFTSQNSSNESIKLAVIGHFCDQDIATAKDILWEKCDSTIIGEKQKRRGSSVRSEKEANTLDILAALSKLDSCGQVPIIAVAGTDLHMIPRINPEEMLPSSVVERVQTLENKFNQVIDSLDRCICENLELKDRIESNSSYAAVCKINNIQTGTKNCAGSEKVSNKHKAPSKETTVTKADEPPVTSTMRRTNSMMSIDNKSVRSVDSEGFRRPKAHIKKMRRNAPAVTGNGKSDGAFKSAPVPPRELFVYHVDRETCTTDINNYMLNKGIKILDLKCMSHENSLSKSFKLKMSQEYVDILLKEDFWPSGIKVRKFIPPKPKIQQ